MADPKKVVCSVCSKPLSALHSVNGTCGTRCDSLRKRGVNQEVIATSLRAYMVSTIPVDHVSMATVHRTIDAHPEWGCSVNRMVKACGEDRPYLKDAKFANPICKPLIAVGSKVRMLHPWLNTRDGIEAMGTGNFSKAPKPASVKKAK
jgi:hypothetical protein